MSSYQEVPSIKRKIHRTYKQEYQERGRKGPPSQANHYSKGNSNKRGAVIGGRVACEVSYRG